jgi:diguanylate cyclase (GGDEF)-like protein
MSKNLPETLFDKLNQAFISDRLLQDTLTDSLQRAQILVGVLAISALSGLFMTLSLGFLCATSDDPLLLLATLIAGLTVAGYLGTLWFFKRRQTLLPAANLYGLTTTFSTVAPCMITGGISGSPYLSIILVVPIFMFLMAGRKYGLYWSLVVVACVVILLLLESSGIQFPQMIADNSMATFRFATWLMTLSLLVLGLVAYEGNFETLNKRITEERSQFAHEALHDPLTGLSNRKLFFSRAREAVDHALAREHKAAVIYVDLDDFKLINDGYGHEAGDDVLNAVAQRLQANVRSEDTVARLGGDEFAIVLHGIQRTETAEFVGNKLRAALQEPLRVGEHDLKATGSIGVAVAPDQGQDIDRLLRTADEAMYRAKKDRSGSLKDSADIVRIELEQT